MEIKLKLDEKTIEKMVKNSIDESDILDETVMDILESDEAKRLIMSSVIEFLNSAEGINTINNAVRNYMENDYDISDYSEITDIIMDSVQKIVKNKFNV